MNCAYCGRSSQRQHALNCYGCGAPLAALQTALAEMYRRPDRALSSMFNPMMSVSVMMSSSRAFLLPKEAPPAAVEDDVNENAPTFYIAGFHGD